MRSDVKDAFCHACAYIGAYVVVHLLKICSDDVIKRNLNILCHDLY